MRIGSNKSKIFNFILLHAVLLMYSFCSVFSKLAAGTDFMSAQFIMFYGIMLVILGAYALLWQQILKRMPLTTAFANKGIVIIWGMILGALFFGEAITWNMIVGSIIVFIGILLVVTDDE
ncbi:MAG: EamA family transporter [Ruminococcus sp.]